MPFDKRCTLWVHDEGFSNEQVIINLDLFDGVLPGDLLVISPLSTDSGTRDIPEKTLVSKWAYDLPSSCRHSCNLDSKISSKTGSIEVRHDTDLGSRYLFVATATQRVITTGLEISVSRHVADAFGLKHRSNVVVSKVDKKICSASHVELSFKDEYLSRSDMWRLTLSELSCKTVYKGQKLLFLGSVKAQVITIYLNGRKVQSAFISPATMPVFRSGSARYVLFIQMSREMWDFDSEGSGEIMFNKVINGFLPTLFKKWVAQRFDHLVSIVLFTRVEYETGITAGLTTDTHGETYYTGIQSSGNCRPYKDFYRVVVYEMASTSWTTILYQLKLEFKFFRRDISMHHVGVMNSESVISSDKSASGTLGSHVEAHLSLAMHGNILEAINLACCQFSYDHIDQDLMRTGSSIVIITPCPGLFEVEFNTLKMTTELLTSYGIQIDLVCLPRTPLHSAPLFRFRNPEHVSFTENLRLKIIHSEDSTPQGPSEFIHNTSGSINSPSPAKHSKLIQNFRTDTTTVHKLPDKWLYAIPNWLNVSFWTGSLHDVNPTKFSAQLRIKHFGSLPPHRLADFEVHCKMYEMEMAGIMESVLTEISVAPLQLNFIPRQIKAGKNRKLPYRSLTELSCRPSSSLITRRLPEDERVFDQLYDIHDFPKSRISDELHKSRLKDAIRRNLRHEGGGSPQNNLLDPGSSGISVSKSIGFVKKPSTFSRQSPRKIKSRFMSSTGASDLWTEKNKPMNTNNNAAEIRLLSENNPRIGHHISLGKHGFSVAAPSAATAEIQTENASSTRLSSGSFDSKGSEFKFRTDLISTSLLPKSGSSSVLTRQSSLGERSRKDQLTHRTNSISSSDHRAKGKIISGKPMTIKSALESLDSTNQVKSRSVLDLFYEHSDQNSESLIIEALQSTLNDVSQKNPDLKFTTDSFPRPPIRFSPIASLSPWLTILNPFNTAMKNHMGSGQHKPLQLFEANPKLVKKMKWRSLCSPASAPLTTEYFPTKNQLDTEYEQKPYNISQNTEDEVGNEVPRGRDEFLRELVGLRLSEGFQIVVGPLVAEAFGQKALKVANIFDLKQISEDGVSIFMSMGSEIHQLSCVNDGEFEINIFVRKHTDSNIRNQCITYQPAIRTKLSQQYESHPVFLGKTKSHYNWNYVDAFLGGFCEEISDNLRFCRARFVLIPVERLSQTHKHPGEDSEEEVHLEGIKKLTQIWQRYKVVASSERRTQNETSTRTKDPNPLDIVYKTEDPSIVVTAELETLPLVETGDNGQRKGQLFRTERFRKSKLDIAALVDAIQAPVEKGGVRMQNRRWHLRLHYNCFIGSDMTTWLIDNFEDIETREKAVKLGNKLMIRDETIKNKEKDNGKEKEKYTGIFVHVEGRHMFRDGQYFYQVTSEFVKQGIETRSGWFASRKRDLSVSSTPIGEYISKDLSKPEQSRSSSNYDELSSDSGTTTPTKPTGARKPRVVLSKVMRYDVDHRRRSFHPEVINLHYDRLHNPDNCYHIRIEWLGVTTKLIHDAIESWIITAERYGLRLVEVPISEASSTNSLNPFRKPYRIKLIIPPPDQQPKTYMDVNSFLPQAQSTSTTPYYYQRAIMKKFNFVLDTEAASNFPSNVDVSYSWGKPNYQFSQYVHRSGVMLAQITDDGTFLLLTNRLHNNQIAKSKEDRNSLTNSRLYDPTTPQSIRDGLEAFCSSVEYLQKFYGETLNRGTLNFDIAPLSMKVVPSMNLAYTRSELREDHLDFNNISLPILPENTDDDTRHEPFSSDIPLPSSPVIEANFNPLYLAEYSSSSEVSFSPIKNAKGLCDPTKYSS